MSKRAWMILIVIAGLSWSSVGCGSGRLETGYKPRLLGASDTQRRAFYASPYSKEAAMAEQDADRIGSTDYRPRRPTP